MPIRYADDFIILVNAPGSADGKRVAEQEKALLAETLKAELGLTLSEERTLVTPVTSTMAFLGHHLRGREHPTHGCPLPLAVIPKARSQHLRRVIKGIFRGNTTSATLENRLRMLNPVLRGWGHFYRHAWGAKRVFAFTDHYVWWTIKRWLRKKHPKTPVRQLYKRYGWRKPRGRSIRWQDGSVRPYPVVALKVEAYRLAWQRTPLFASTSMESPVRNERRTPGSARGRQKPPGETQEGR